MEISTVISDTDGCWTPNTFVMDSAGRRSRIYNFYDGVGVRLLKDAGIEVLLFSGEQDPSIWHRADELGVEFVHAPDKLQAALDLGLDLSKVAFMGNDESLDLELLREVAFPACPADAELAVRRYCKENGLVVKGGGGDGAFKDLAKFLLAAVVHVSDED